MGSVQIRGWRMSFLLHTRDGAGAIGSGNLAVDYVMPSVSTVDTQHG
jgi:hypothetical protein